MMAPEVYERARADAPIHVQVWRPRVETSPPRANHVRIDGRVVRLFRNHGGVLHWGQRVSFSVSVRSPNAPPEAPMLGGEIRHAWERIGPARYLEAFLQSWDGKIELVHSQVAPIRHPTLRPVCDHTVHGFVCPGNV
jgi:hypothetical protein